MFVRTLRHGFRVSCLVNLMPARESQRTRDGYRFKHGGSFVVPFIVGREQKVSFSFFLIRFFRADNSEGASFFRSRMRVDILSALWNPKNIPILVMSKMPKNTQQIHDFEKCDQTTGTTSNRVN